MVKKLLFSSTATQKRVAILEDGKVAEYIVEQPDDCRILGNIYRAKVSKIIPSIQSAFIDIGDGKDAFLNVSDLELSLLPEVEEEELLAGNIEDLEKAPSLSDSQSEIEELSVDDSDGSEISQLSTEADDDIEFEDTDEADKKSKRVAIERLIEEGQELIVQVCKEPIGGKSPKATTKISLAGRFTVLVPDNQNIGISKKSASKKERRKLRRALRQMLPDGMGCIVRTIGLEVTEEMIYNELKQLVAEWDIIQAKAVEGEEPCLLYKEQNVITAAIRNFFSKDVEEVLVDNQEDYDDILAYLNKVSPEMIERVILYTQSIPLFDAYDIERDLEKSHRRKIWLKSGGYLFFDKTEALLAIDVNSGRNTSEATLEDTVFAVNMEAAIEIARQLRLRDIGGIIVVDFIDMKKGEHRHTLEKTMREYLKNDSTNTACSDLSRFGLMEMTRKRVRPGINELMTDVCPSCHGMGRIFSVKTIASKIDRWLHRAAAEKKNAKTPVKILVSQVLFDYIEQENLREQFEKNHKRKLDFKVLPRLEQDEFEIYIKESGENIAEKHL